MLLCFYFSGIFHISVVFSRCTKLTDGVNISGSGTTLTVSNITSPDDDGKSFYLESAFSSGLMILPLVEVWVNQ